MQPTRHPDRFVDRHLGPDARDVEEMLATLGVRNLDELIDRTVPASIRLQRQLDLPAGHSEFGLLHESTAAAEAMTMFHNIAPNGSNAFYVAPDCHPQTIEVVRTRAKPFGI